MMIAEFKLTEDLTSEVLNKLSAFHEEYGDVSRWATIEVLSSINNITYSLLTLRDITSYLEGSFYANGIKVVFANEYKDTKDHVLDISIKLFDEEPKINTDLILA